MCTGLEIIGLVGGALGAVGQVVQMKQQEKQMAAMAEARNNKLRSTLAKNDAIAEESRDTFARRQSEATAEQMDADQQKATDTRQEALEGAVTEAPAAEGPTLSGSAPTVVKSELAKKMAETLANSKEQAARSARLGGFGDSWLNQGFKDVQAGREIGQQANFAAGNMAILPYQQDIAEVNAMKPASPLGGLLQGFGGMLSGFAGSGGMGGIGRGVVPKKDPWAGMRGGYL